MKQRGKEVTCQFKNNKNQGRLRPCTSCIVIHINMTLEPNIWCKNLDFFSWKYGEWLLSSFQWDWMLTESQWTMHEIWISVNIPWTFTGHSEMFQLTERRIFILSSMKTFIFAVKQCPYKLLYVTDVHFSRWLSSVAFSLTTSPISL